MPIGLIAANASEAALVVQGKPVAAVQLVLALAIWTILFVWPTARVVRRFGSRRVVVVDRETVTVADDGLFQHRTVSRPLADFSGICHVVRTTLSGVRHELMLVDPVGRGHVVFHAEDRVGPETIARATALLGLPEIPARAVLRLPRA